MDEKFAISIEKDEIPYSFQQVVSGQMLDFTVKYNALSDIFTIDLKYADTGNVIKYGIPLIYGRDIFESLDEDLITNVSAIPYDVARQEEEVTYANMNELVFLFVEGDIQ